NWRSWPSGSAPWKASTGWPPTSRNTVGTERIWNAAATCCCWSTSTLASTKAPPYSPASFSRIGPSDLHGPHQVAQKSTSTGVCSDFCRTSVSKFSVVTSTTWGRLDMEGSGCGYVGGRWSRGRQLTSGCKVQLTLPRAKVKFGLHRVRQTLPAADAANHQGGQEWISGPLPIRWART